MIKQYEIILPGFKRGVHLITRYIEEALTELPKAGIANIFLQHTSAGLCINENADPDVRIDMDNFFRKIVPENTNYFLHTYEGKDDMPAHILSTILGISLSIPIKDNKLGLGIWQGIYLGEFRNDGGARKITITIYS